MRTPPRDCGAPPTSWSLRRRLDSRRTRLRRRRGRRGARAQSRPGAAARQPSARRSAIPPRGARACAATASRSCGRRDCCSGARASASTRPRAGRRSRGTARPGAGASRSRTRRCRSAMPRSSCARSPPRSRSATPTRSTRPSSPPRWALAKRRLPLAGALWQLPGDEIDAFDGGLVDVGAGDWYTAQQIRDAERRRRPDAAARGRAGRGRPLDARRRRAPSRLRVPLDALRLAERACRRRWRASSAPRRSTPTPARCSAGPPAAALHADAPARVPEAHRVPPHAGRELRRRPALRPVRALGAGLERPAQRRAHGR